MRTVPLTEAAAELGKSERTVRRMIEAGTLHGEQFKAAGRYRWMVTMPESASLPAIAEQPDALAVLLRIEAKLDQLLAWQSASAGTLPAPWGTTGGESAPPEPEQPRPSWWRRFIGVFAP